MLNNNFHLGTPTTQLLYCYSSEPIAHCIRMLSSNDLKRRNSSSCPTQQSAKRVRSLGYHATIASNASSHPQITTPDIVAKLPGQNQQPHSITLLTSECKKYDILVEYHIVCARHREKHWVGFLALSCRGEYW